MRVVAIGDIGVVDDMMHIGDEAMFECGSRGTRCARRPSHRRLLRAGRVRRPLRGGGRRRASGSTDSPRDAAEARLAAVLALAEDHDRLPLGRPRHAPSSPRSPRPTPWSSRGAATWPRPGRCTSTSGRRSRASPTGSASAWLSSGQTLGPSLHGRDRELVAASCARRMRSVCGSRRPSTLAADLGAAARLGVDDASFLGMTEEDAAAGRDRRARQPLAQSSARVTARRDRRPGRRAGGRRRRGGGWTGALPRALRPAGAAASRGATRVLHEEVRAPDADAVDRLCPRATRGAAASLARSAALLITGRYHPAVFAAPAGVPVLGLTTDEYTMIKQRGALAHWGQDATVPDRRGRDEGIAPRTLWATGGASPTRRERGCLRTARTPPTGGMPCQRAAPSEARKRGQAGIVAVSMTKRYRTSLLTTRS